MRKFVCSGERMPMLQLALDKKACLRVSGEKLRTAAAIAEFVTRHYGCAPQEHVLSILMANTNEVIGVQEVAKGGLGAAPVDPRVVFGGAMTAGAAALILVHNHPSGDPEPSQADDALTKHLVAGAKLLGIRVLDHVVVGRGGKYVSMAERGFSFGEAE